MIRTPKRQLRAAFGRPAIAAYTFFAGIVFFGRELDLVGDVMRGALANSLDGPLTEFAARTGTNMMIGAVWPRFLYATLEALPFMGVLVGYMALVLILYIMDRLYPRTPSEISMVSCKSPGKRSREASEEGQV